ncbi:MAG: ion channel [Pirellulales bacterium]|nr:ion channel [Pirellulales bacterium]
MTEETVRTQRGFIAFARAHRFATLLAALMLMFFYGPIVQLFAQSLQPLVARVGVGVSFTLMLLAAVFGVSNDRRLLWRTLLLAVPTIVAELADVVFFTRETHIISHTLGAIFLFYVIVVLFRFIFSTKRVTEDTIYAALCVYLLAAVMWALGYSLLSMYEDNAFYYSMSEQLPPDAMRFGAVPAGLEFYFSIVTMTTLGYGDIVPVSSAARAMATFQAVVGQLYLAVLVARLVGLHVAESARKQD